MAPWQPKLPSQPNKNVGPPIQHEDIPSSPGNPRIGAPLKTDSLRTQSQTQPPARAVQMLNFSTKATNQSPALKEMSSLSTFQDHQLLNLITDKLNDFQQNSHEENVCILNIIDKLLSPKLSVGSGEDEKMNFIKQVIINALIKLFQRIEKIINDLVKAHPNTVTYVLQALMM